MDVAGFRYNGEEYSGFVVCSRRMEPHYYWFICRDEELINKLGEDVAFILKDGELSPLNYTLAERHPGLFQAMIEALLQYLPQEK